MNRHFLDVAAEGHTLPSRGRVYSAALAVGALLLLLVVAVAGLLFAAPSTAALSAIGVVQGTNLVQTRPADTLPPDYSDALTLMDVADDLAFDQFMRAIPGRRKKVTQVKVGYFKRDRDFPRLDTATTATAAGGAGALKTFLVATVAMWRVNDLVEIADTPAAPMLVITAVNAGAGTITVAALPSGPGASSEQKVPDTYGTVPAITNGQGLVRIANVKTEADTPSGPRRNVMIADFNYCQTYDVYVEQSTHAQIVANYTGQSEVAMNRAEALVDHRRSVAADMLFGKRSNTVGENGRQRWTQKGLMNHDLDTYAFSDGSLTENNIMDLMYQAGTGNSGSRSRILIGGSDLTRNFDKANLSKMQTTRGDKMLGVETLGISSRVLNVRVVYDPLFDLVGRENEGLIFDPASLFKAEFRPFSPNKVDYKAQGVRDAEGEWFQETCCLEVHNPAAHMKLRIS